MKKQAETAVDKKYSHYVFIKDKIFIIMLLVLIALMMYSITLGRYEIGMKEALHIMVNKVIPIYEVNWSDVKEQVVLLVRLPRILCAALIGMGLSIAGVAAQGLFRNPLVDSSVIGVTSGAAFGGVLGILLFGTALMTLGFAFVFGVITIGLVLILSRIKGRISLLSLILVGIVISTFFNSAISIIKLLADPFAKLPTITYWLMGSIASVNFQSVTILLATVLPAIIIIMLLKYQFNIISLGEQRAQALGCPYNKIRIIILLCISLISAGIVSVAGSVGWIGLIIPHITRRFVGANHVRILPIAALLGAIFMIIIDDFARFLSTSEIPLGIMTSLIGVPVFTLVLRRTQKKGGWTDD